MLYSIKAKKIIVYQRFECNLLLLDISIRTLWIISSTGATNVAGTAYHSQAPDACCSVMHITVVF
jgi:hypothetical protein